MVSVAGIELPVRPGRAEDPRVPGPEAELVLTPTTREHLRLLAQAIAWGRRPPLLEGETGVGKSALVRYLAYLTHTPVYWVNLCEQTDPSELIGKYVPVGRDEFAWVDGVLIRAMKEGAWIFLDDINLAPSQILERINPLLDEDAFVIVTEHEGEKVIPQPGFRLFAARNPLHYRGRQRLSLAFVNKFNLIHIREHPPEEMEQILAEKGLEPEVARAMVELLLQVRKLSQGKPSRLGGYRFGLRDLLRFRDYLVAYRDAFGLGPAFAKGAMYVFWDRLETWELREEFLKVLGQVGPVSKEHLEKAVRERRCIYEIEPGIKGLFRELAWGVDHWALRTAEMLLGSREDWPRLLGLRAAARIRLIAETLGPGIAEELVGLLEGIHVAC